MLSAGQLFKGGGAGTGVFGISLAVAALIIATTGLYFGDRSLAAAPVVGSIENETMSLPAGGSIINDPSASGGQALKLTANNSYAQGSVNLSGNAVTLILRARGDFCNAAWPRVSLYVDGTNVANPFITSDGWSDYSIATSKTTGPHTVRAIMRNAYSNATCTRAAYLDVEVFYGEDVGPPPPVDYTTEALSVSPTNILSGQSLSFAATVRNVSANNAQSGSDTSLRLDTGNDGTYDVIFANLPTAALVAGGSEVKNWADIWIAVEGTHRFEVCADATALLEETNEANNCSTLIFTVSPPAPPQPVLDFSANPATIVSGGSSTLTWTAANVDNCTASGAWSGQKPLSGSESTGPLNDIQTYTYTLTCGGPYGSVSKNATVTVTQTPPPGGCTIADTSGCTAGREISLTDSTWFCDKPLSNYGTLPIKVVLNFTTILTNNGADLRTGCAGDSDPNTIDLILDVKGDGMTYGPGEDGVKVRQQAGWNSGIQITGRADCGPRSNSDVHQDGVHAQGGRNITFVDFKVGNYDNGLSTCQGAGGAFFFASAVNYYAENTHVIRGKYIACNKGLTIGSAGNTGSVTDALIRGGRVDGTDPKCIGLNGPVTCGGSSAVVVTNVTCQRWNSLSQTFVTLLWP